MIKIKKIEDMGWTRTGWLEALHHFSFGDYNDATNVSYGPLRVLNDDVVKPGKGFESHPHRDMEIISYVIDGKLTHWDSILTEEKTVSRGSIQYMSAGSGIIHSEINKEENDLRFAQMWIFPNAEGLNPLYNQVDFPWEARINKWFLMVSSHDGNAPVKLYQDVEIYALYLEKGKKIRFPLNGLKNSFYLAVLEGSGRVNGITVKEREDAYGDESFELEAEQQDMHVLLFIV